jgi:hypothetical protein
MATQRAKRSSRPSRTGGVAPEHAHGRGPGRSGGDAVAESGLPARTETGVGALVLYADRMHDQVPIELFRPRSGEPVARSSVRARRLPGRTLHAAVFPHLPAGDYVVTPPGSTASVTVTVEAGRITEARLFSSN